MSERERIACRMQEGLVHTLDAREVLHWQVAQNMLTQLRKDENFSALAARIRGGR